MEIRKPNDSELKKVISLSPQAIYDGTLEGVRPTKTKVEQLITALLEKGSYYLIASGENCLKGWVLIGSSKDQFTDKVHGFIYELFVLEEYRGKGISKLLMKTAIDSLKQEGYTEIRLSSYAGNQAIKLYEQMGFQTRTVSMNLLL